MSRKMLTDTGNGVFIELVLFIRMMFGVWCAIGKCVVFVGFLWISVGSDLERESRVREKRRVDSSHRIDSFLFTHLVHPQLHGFTFPVVMIRYASRYKSRTSDDDNQELHCTPLPRYHGWCLSPAEC